MHIEVWQTGPFMFMIDDFANKYMTDKLDGNYVGSDWAEDAKRQFLSTIFYRKRFFGNFICENDVFWGGGRLRELKICRMKN